MTLSDSDVKVCLSYDSGLEGTGDIAHQNTTRKEFNLGKCWPSTPGVRVGPFATFPSPEDIPLNDGVVDDEDESDDTEQVRHTVPHHGPPVQVNRLQQSYTWDT